MSMAQMSWSSFPPYSLLIILSPFFCNPYGYISTCYPKYAHGSGLKGQESPQKNAHTWMHIICNSLTEYAYGDFSQKHLSA